MEFDEAAKAIEDNVIGVQGDVSKPTDLDRLYETVNAEGRRMPSLGLNLPALLACRAAVAAFERCNPPLQVSDAAIKIAKSVHIGRFRDSSCPKDDAFPERRRGVLV